MSLFKKIAEKLASESGELKKIKVEAEKRRAAKSSGELPKVSGDPVDKTIAALTNRVQQGSDPKKP
ncbi:MAG TPA: hypothetical protein VGP72_28765 [Planctomycetota bacterium]|jgi:hypothetical protein